MLSGNPGRPSCVGTRSSTEALQVSQEPVSGWHRGGHASDALVARANRGLAQAYSSARSWLSVLPHGHEVSTTLDASYATLGTRLTDAARGRLVAALTQRGITKSQPIVVYGDNAESGDALTAVLRLLSAGYSQVSWMRSGIEGLLYSGLPVGSVGAL